MCRQTAPSRCMASAICRYRHHQPPASQLARQLLPIISRTCASSNAPRCGSFSLHGDRHMPVSSLSAVCKPACTATVADNLQNMRQLECAARRPLLAAWRPPYAGIVTICRLQASLHTTDTADTGRMFILLCMFILCPYSCIM